MRYIFRFDDVSINTDEIKLLAMIGFIRDRLHGSWVEIMLSVSPGVHEISDAGLASERVFPSMLHTESDFRAFYKVTKIGIPPVVQQRRERNLHIAAHGLIHVDHRLLSKSAQELSILTSCSLLDTTTFVPPFHKWNKKTEKVCKEHVIRLVQFDANDWRHLAYQPFDPNHAHYYLHTHDFTLEQFSARFP